MSQEDSTVDSAGIDRAFNQGRKAGKDYNKAYKENRILQPDNPYTHKSPYWTAWNLGYVFEKMEG